ncbi:hypothetical protein J2S21_002600 [Peribacillus cavernae]|nr:hypothetical protein [Peribacillus cavernae]
MFWFVTMTLPKMGLLFTFINLHLLGDACFSPHPLPALLFRWNEVTAMNNSG